MAKTREKKRAAVKKFVKGTPKTPEPEPVPPPPPPTPPPLYPAFPMSSMFVEHPPLQSDVFEPSPQQDFDPAEEVPLERSDDAPSCNLDAQEHDTMVSVNGKAPDQLSASERMLIFLMRQSQHPTSMRRLKAEIEDAQLLEETSVTFYGFNQFKEKLLAASAVEVTTVCAICAEQSCQHLDHHGITVKKKAAKKTKKMRKTKKPKSAVTTPAASVSMGVEDVDVGDNLPVAATPAHINKQNARHVLHIATSLIKPQLRSIYLRNRQHLTDGIHLTINCDGVVPRDHKKKPFWTLLASIQNLPTGLRGKADNMVVVGVASGKVKTEHLEKLADRLLAELHDGCFYVPIDNTIKKVTVTVDNATMDLPAACKCYTLSNYNALRTASCCYCLDEAYRCPEKRCQLWRIQPRAPVRSDDSMEGITRITSFSKLCPVTHLRLDFLHICDEGLIKLFCAYWYEDHDNDLYVGEAIKKAILDGYSSCGGRIASSEIDFFSRYNSLCGHDRRFMFNDTLPHLVLNSWITKPESHDKCAALLGFWIITRLLLTQPSEEVILKVADMIEILRPHIQSAFDKDCATIKAHLFFVHAPDELRRHGSVTEFSAALFESLNFRLQKDVNFSNTKGFITSLINCHNVRLFISEHVESRQCSQKFLKWLDRQNVQPTHYTTYPQSRIHEVESLIDIAALRMCKDSSTLLPLSKIRIGMDMVPVTQSPYFIKLSSPSLVVKPVLGFLADGEVFVLVGKIFISDPFQNLYSQNAYPYLQSLAPLQHFVFHLDAVPTDPSNYFVVPAKTCLSYMFTFPLFSMNLLIEGSESVSKL